MLNCTGPARRAHGRVHGTRLKFEHRLSLGCLGASCMLHQRCSHVLQGLKISQEVPCLGGCPLSWGKVRVHTDGEHALLRGFHAGVCPHTGTDNSCMFGAEWYPIVNGSWLEADADQLGSVLGAWGLMVKALTKSRQPHEGFTFGGSHIPCASVKTAKCGREM